MDSDGSFQAVPKRLIDGISEMGGPPPKGSGRLRLDFSVSLGNILVLIVVVLLVLIILDRINTRSELTQTQLNQHLQMEINQTQRIEVLENWMRTWINVERAFPLHRHIIPDAAEIYPDPTIRGKKGAPGYVIVRPSETK